MTLTLAGVGVGLIGAFAVTRFAQSMLFEVTATRSHHLRWRRSPAHRGIGAGVLLAGATRGKGGSDGGAEGIVSSE